MSKTDIANMGLGHLGIAQQISDLDADTAGVLAKAIRLYYDTALSKVLSARDWGFARRVATLALVATDPTVEWLYSYRMPSLCVQPLRIVSGFRPDDVVSKIPFEQGSDSSGTLIFTNEECALLEYTHLMTDPTFYPPDFTLAFSALLAHFTAPRLAAGDPHDLGQRAFGLYIGLTLDAAAADGSGQSPPPPPVSSIEAARG